MKIFYKLIQSRINYRYRPSVYGIILRQGSLLITSQSNLPIEENFQLPGGKIEVVEQVIPALIRKVLEETGWKIQFFRKLYCYRRFILCWNMSYGFIKFVIFTYLTLFIPFFLQKKQGIESYYYLPK